MVSKCRARRLAARAAGARRRGGRCLAGSEALDPPAYKPSELRSDVAARPDELEEVVAVHLEQLPGRFGSDRRGPRRLVEQADLAEHLVRAELTQDAARCRIRPPG